ncbi:unnamed protein product [Cunninghamella blakesleeana]
MGINLSKEHGGMDERLLEGNGLYHLQQDYDKKKVRKFIITKKLAPFYKGLEGLENDKKSEKMTKNQDDHMTNENDVIECPICFLSYPSNINYTRCCDQPICTECFVQFKRTDPTLPVSCPFCVQPHFGVTYQPPKSSIPSNYQDHNIKQQRRLSMFQINPIPCISKDTTFNQRHTSLPPSSSVNNSNIIRQQNESSTKFLLSTLKKRKGVFKVKQNKNGDNSSQLTVIQTDDIRPLSSYPARAASNISRPTSSYIITTDLTMNSPNFEDWMVLEAVRRSIQDQQDDNNNNSNNNHSNFNHSTMLF